MSIAVSSANQSRIVSRSAAKCAMARALSLFVGRGRRYSVKQLSNATGVPDRVIESAKCDPETTDFRLPSMEDILSLSSFLGPQFTGEWLREAGQGAYWLPDADDTPPGAMAAEAVEDAAAITRGAMDGKFDRSDVVDLQPHARRMMARGAQILAMGAAA